MLLGTNLNAQAWLKRSGEMYSQIGLSSISGSSKYNGKDSPVNLLRSVSDLTLQFYHEQGISNHLMISSSIPYKFISTGDEILNSNSFSDTLEAGRLNALGNINLAILYGNRIDDFWVYSFKLSSTFNTSKANSTLGIRTGEDTFGLFPSFNLGMSRGVVWSSINGGIKFRSNGYSNQFLSNIQVGSKIGSNTLLILAFDIVKSLEKVVLDFNNDPFSHTGLYSNYLEFSAFTLKTGYSPEDSGFSIWASIGGGVSGNEVIRAPAFNLAVSYDIQK